MSITAKLDQLHYKAKGNKWLRYFAVFNRVALASGFLPAGIVKIMGERFASGLSVNHPMGHYLESLHLTGYYYPFIGIVQITAAILLLIPRTATLGAVLYFPVILNICILSFAVRFDGSLLTSPLMVLGNLYLLCWDYDKLKYILPFNRPATLNDLSQQKAISNKFPTLFFAGVAATIALLVLIVAKAFTIMPHNNLRDCQAQCADSKNPSACAVFCDCIHQKGEPLDKCLDQYNMALKNKVR